MGRESDAKLDLKYWGEMPGWKLSEAAALFLGLEPDDVKKWKVEGDNSNDVRTEYLRLRRRLKRAKEMDAISSPLSPREAVEWARSNGINVADALKDSVRGTRGLKNWRTRYLQMRRKKANLENEIEQLKSQLKEDVENPKRRKTFYRLILGMAKKHYGLESHPHQATSKIERDLEGTPYKLGNDVIRKCLQEAQQEIAE